MSTEDDVVGASQTFYAALNRMLNGDASSLGDIWSHSNSVITMHPIGGPRSEVGARAEFLGTGRAALDGR
ncbi:hypothetical protein WPS_18510 [Vulcanimicrobium alpinum]|uniref:DUF4440 domain-containing protein n=1 Tax=Vulcanimicrobium alpinum TaxID=3016050 RepID=A0AAN1XW98_UNVUL|nr:hypothetical protein [Vulcanimicrobium alpinum]BDE06575.1 hypothetical protein WPS_18510 [Vulcanimicrobium alpinum]